MECWSDRLEPVRCGLFEWLICDERFNTLRWHEQGFFFRLVIWADADWRFNASPVVLRASLYPLCLHKVSVKEVEAMLRRLAECDFVKLRDYNGQVYGKVVWERFGASNCAHLEDASALGNVPVVDGVSAVGAAKNSVRSAVEELRE